MNCLKDTKMKNDITICIPVRGGSRRIPRKNLLTLGGESLLARKIRQTLPLGRVVVGSDDAEMLQEAERCGAETIRRKCTNEGRDSANDMIAEFMRLIPPCETILWAHCTNPFISTATYADALACYYLAREEGYDSLFSVRELRGHFWDSKGEPLYDLDRCRERHICANDLDPIYEQDGGIFIQSYAQMRKNHYFFGSRPLMYTIEEAEYCDINTPLDWEICQWRFEHEAH